MLKIAWSPIYCHPLPEGHRFPMEKYDLLPKQLIYEGTIDESSFFEPEPVAENIILQTHDTDYWNALKTLQLDRKAERKIGFPLSEKLVEREVIITQGTIDCARYAKQNGVAMNVAGGTHHAYTNRGEGFCMLNDIGVAATYLLSTDEISKVLVVDLDVHQGNGTAEIFADEPKVFTFSMHGAKNYPAKKEASDLDIGMPDKTDDATYLKTLKETLPRLLDEVEPDFIFYLSGVDVLETDKLGRLGMSIQGCKARDKFVLETCKQNDLPVCISMGGGYSPRIADIIEAHANTYRLAQEIWF